MLLELINFGSKNLKKKIFFLINLDSEILLSKVLKKKEKRNIN